MTCTMDKGAAYVGRTYAVSTDHTPWGATQDYETIAEGIRRVSTASHGGYVLSEPRMAEFHARLSIHFQSFAGYGYFEEDQDWAAVAIAFPEFFSEEDLYHAVETVKASAQPWESLPDIHLRWLPLVAWLEQDGNPVALIAARFRAERAGFWQVGSMMSSGHGWQIHLRRLKDGATRIVTFAEYPGQRFYNDCDLKVLDITA